MVSIVVAVYNIETYLPACVESLVKQTERDLEILLVDDGSTDASGRICDELALSDDRIRVIHKANGGLSDARNAGLEQAKGDWVLFVDGDDYLAEDAVERLLAVAQPDADFVQFHYYETEDVSWKPPKDQPANPVVCTDRNAMWNWLYEKGGVAASSCTKLWSRRLFGDLRFKKGIIQEDEELINRILPRCQKVIYTDLVLYGYVMRTGSIVRSGFKPKSMDVFPILEARIRVLTEQGIIPLVKETQRRMFQTAAWQYCLAKKGGYAAEAKDLKQRILALAKEKELSLSGQYRLLHRLAGGLSFAPELYYFIRRISGKT